jgi:nitrogen fixation/metabolism regulation signal transduction histidine kinase
MVIKALTRISLGFWPVAALFVLLLISLYLMSAATQNSHQFGMLFSSLLVINLLGLAVLVILIGANLHRLWRQYRNSVPGSRLAVRLVIMFIILALTPVSVVYYFSLQFLQHGIDSWFDVRLEKTLEDALELSRTALDAKMREYRKQTESMANQLADVPNNQASFLLNDLRERSGATELTLLSQDGRILASSTVNPSTILPHRPDDTILFQLRQGLTYVGLDPIGESGLYVRVALQIGHPDPMSEARLLQALYPVAERMSNLADNVQAGYAQYQELTYLRKPVKISFTLTLSLVLLLSLLTAVWAAFYSARRLVAPIRVLAIGTRAVASGDYNRRLPLPPNNDELSFLVQSFNDMTRKLAQARDSAHESQAKVEEHRSYLATLLGRLTSGVFSLSKTMTLRTANSTAGQILGVDLEEVLGQPLEAICTSRPYLQHFVDVLRPHVEHEWREQVVLFGAGGRQILMCRGALLPSGAALEAEHVIVFDDVTALIQAQRDAAWGEVARRLAHEIKNPLTPIQLSAERLRHKYLKTMDPKDAEVLDRSTHTIVQQVEALKEMVKAFSEYARPPQLQLRPLDLNQLINEVIELYRADDKTVHITTRLDQTLPDIQADPGRLRQLLHNLIKNGIEAAGGGGAAAHITITTGCVQQPGFRIAEVRIRDDGPGFPAEILANVFEPYVTTKPKGTGLGLAIVKKIVEEHGGVVWADNPRDGGARIVICFPVDAGLHEDNSHALANHNTAEGGGKQ